LPTQARLRAETVNYRLDDVIALLRHADMSSTYKPALLAAIVRCVLSRQGRSDRIALDELAAHYLEMYWSQVVVFRLRHSPRDGAQPEIVQRILTTAARLGIRRLADLPGGERASLVGSIGRILPVNVLTAFHRSMPTGSPKLFAWEKGWQDVMLEPGARPFIEANGASLTLIANYYWARFLSRLNTAPYLIDKLERPVPTRSSLAKYARVLGELGERSCFYCGKRPLERRDVHIDHFIPWTFAFEDRLWNLVVACSACNARKADRIPDQAALDRLVALNRIRNSSPAHKPASLLRGGKSETDLVRLWDLAREEQWPPWVEAPNPPA